MPDHRILSADPQQEPVTGNGQTGVNDCSTGGAGVRNGHIFGEDRGTIYLRVADITLAVCGASSDFALDVDQATRRFLVNPVATACRISCGWGAPADTDDGHPVFAAGHLWRLIRRAGVYEFRFHSPPLGHGAYKTARFDAEFSAGEVSLHPRYFRARQPVYPLEYPLDELLMLHLLAKGRGAEVHACGILDAGGRGHLFLGNSGAGKSTLARLCRAVTGVTVLSDDRIIIRRLDGRLWMYGTPWHGEAEAACAARAPLARIYFLRHGRQNALMAQRPAEAVGRLFACCFPLFYSPDALAFTLGFFEEVVKDVPCSELQFLPDARVVELVLQHDE